MNRRWDVIIIGGGPAGLASAAAASDRGADVCLIERENRLGGILKQCIHDGFGTLRFGERLTGPEYAWRYEMFVRERPITVMTDTFLNRLERGGAGFRLRAVNRNGVEDLETVSLVSATGCREKTDRQVFIHGERPAGVLTAGQAQNLINLKGLLPGKKCVILGSGDIGLIMARRMTLEGAEVVGVFEINGEPSGLTRNVAQCLEDFDIPLHLNTTVTEVHGKRRIDGVTVRKVDNSGRTGKERGEFVSCDCLILSVGLIPENDLITPLGADMDTVTGGPLVDQNLETTVPGLFSCGNALQVYDLVDYVTESGVLAGEKAAESALDLKSHHNDGDSFLSLEPGEGIAYAIPQRIRIPMEGGLPLFFRCRKSADAAEVILEQGKKRVFGCKLAWPKPSEMIRIEVPLGAAFIEGESLSLRFVPFFGRGGK